MRTLLWMASLLAGAVALAGGWRTVQAAVEVAGTRARLDRAWAGEAVDVPLHGIRVARLNGAAAGDSVDLGTLERAVVLVYEPSCQATDLNMPNWMDVVRAAPPGAPLYALTYQRSAPAENLAYWDGMHARVALLGTTTQTLVERIRISGTPATLVVRDGRIRRAWSGVIQPATRDELLRVLSDPAPGAGAPLSGVP